MNSKEQDFIRAISYYCSTEKVAVFLKEFDVNHRFNDGTTPLMIAVTPDTFGDHNNAKAILNMVDFLIANRADKNILDHEGLKAEDYAKRLIDKNWKDELGNGYPLEWFDALETLNKIISIVTRSR